MLDRQKELENIRDEARAALRRMTQEELRLTFIPSELERFRRAGLIDDAPVSVTE